MKALALVVLLLASTAWAEGVNPRDSHFERLMIDAYQKAYEYDRGWRTGTTDYVQAMDSSRSRIIRKWAASGEICRVLGHRWGDYEYEWSGTLTLNPCRKPVKETRKCTICGKVETKEEVWK